MRDELDSLKLLGGEANRQSRELVVNTWVSLKLQPPPSSSFVRSRGSWLFTIPLKLESAKEDVAVGLVAHGEDGDDVVVERRCLRGTTSGLNSRSEEDLRKSLKGTSPSPLSQPYDKSASSGLA